MKPYIKGLYNKRDEMVKKILDYQSKCKHTNVQRTSRGATGNYDPSWNCYWYDCRCVDCDKFWKEDQ